MLIFAVSKRSKIARKSHKKRTQIQTYLGQPLETQKIRFLCFLSSLLAPNLGPTWLYLGSKAAKNELLSWPCLNHGWPRAVQTQKPTKMRPISVRKNSKFGSNRLHVQLGLELLQGCFYTMSLTHIHRPTSPSSCYDAQLMVVPLLCCLLR